MTSLFALSRYLEIGWNHLDDPMASVFPCPGVPREVGEKAFAADQPEGASILVPYEFVKSATFHTGEEQ